MDLILLAIVCLTYTISPGPSTICLFVKSIKEGFRPALLMGTGEFLSDLIYLVLALSSLGAIANLLEPILPLLRLFAAGLLIYMGIKAWRETKQMIAAEKSPTFSSGKSNFFLGFFVCLSNPKVLAFYFVFLPVFIDLESLSLQSLIIDGVVVLTSIGIGILIVIALGRFVASLNWEKIPGRWIKRLFGSTLIGLGVAIGGS